MPVPVIEIVDPVDGGVALKAGLGSLRPDDWVVITSPNGAARVAAAVAEVTLADGVNIAVVGPGTKVQAESLGLRVDLVPDDAIAEGLVAAFPPRPVDGGRVLLARAEVAREMLPHQLRMAGWQVDEVVAYRTRTVAIDDAARRMVAGADAVVLRPVQRWKVLSTVWGRRGSRPWSRRSGLPPLRSQPGAVSALTSKLPTTRSPESLRPSSGTCDESGNRPAPAARGRETLMMEPCAVIFDFDGTIVDTEWPVYEAARVAHEHHGLDLPIEEWVQIVGTADNKPLDERIRTLLGRDPDLDAIERAKEEHGRVRLSSPASRASVS